VIVSASHWMPVLVTGPASEPVTLAEAKNHLRIDANDEDDYISSLITVARQHIENAGNLALLTQTWKLACDEFPWRMRKFPWETEGRLDEILIYPGPLIAVSSIKYYDTDGLQQTLATTEYAVDSSSKPARVYPAYGKYWPATRSIPNAVEINFTAGYANAASVPQQLKEAMLLLIAHLYENRDAGEGAFAAQTLGTVQSTLDILISPYRIF